MGHAIGQPQDQPTPAAVRAAEAEQITGFRIMRQTEIAPGWWGTPSEVGDTPSATVAYNFCTEQNKVTLNPNRAKRIEFFANPVYAQPEPLRAPLPPQAQAALTRLDKALGMKAATR